MLAPAETCGEAEAPVFQIVSIGINPMPVFDRVKAGSGSGVALTETVMLNNPHVVAA